MNLFVIGFIFINCVHSLPTVSTSYDNVKEKINLVELGQNSTDAASGLLLNSLLLKNMLNTNHSLLLSILQRANPTTVQRIIKLLYSLLQRNGRSVSKYDIAVQKALANKLKWKKKIDSLMFHLGEQEEKIRRAKSQLNTMKSQIVIIQSQKTSLIQSIKKNKISYKYAMVSHKNAMTVRSQEVPRLNREINTIKQIIQMVLRLLCKFSRKDARTSFHHRIIRTHCDAPPLFITSSHWYLISVIQLKFVAVSSDGSHIWGIRPSGLIYYYHSGKWRLIPGRLKSISVSSNGKHVWGVNNGNRVFYRNGAGGKWKYISNFYRYVSVSGDGQHVWGITVARTIYCRNGVRGKWKRVSGKLRQISVSGNGAHVWGISIGYNIYFRTGYRGRWRRISGKLLYISVSANAMHVWGVDRSYNIFYRAGIKGRWSKVSGKLKQLSVLNNGFVWGCNPSNYVYVRRKKGSVRPIHAINLADSEWRQVSGRFKYVACSADGKHIWALSATKKIYYCTGPSGRWRRVSGRLLQISVSLHGMHVWGVNLANHIYYRNGLSGRWKRIGGQLKYIAVSGDGKHVWAINRFNYVYYRTGLYGVWKRVNGRLMQIAVCGNGKHVWGVNRLNLIYYRNGFSGRWIRISGKLKYISVSANGPHVWGVNAANTIFYRFGVKALWIHVPGKLVQITVLNTGLVWGCNSRFYIYVRVKKGKKCPAKIPGAGSPCDVVSELRCKYHAVKCCGVRRHRMVSQCVKGRWLLHRVKMRCEPRCPNRATCPAKAPRTFSRCYLKKGTACKYGYINCCGRKIATHTSFCYRGKWFASMKRIICRKCKKKGKRKEGQTCGIVYGIGFVGKCVAGLVCKKRPPALFKKPSRNDPHICMKKAASKCPAKPLRVHARCNIKSSLTCRYGHVKCCGRKIPIYTGSCQNGRWTAFSATVRCGKCLSGKCPAKVPKARSRCKVKRGIYCKYGFYKCCKRKLPAHVLTCYKGRWMPILHMRRCRCKTKCPAKAPRTFSRCHVKKGIACHYAYVKCCGKKISTHTSFCNRGKWMNLMKHIRCRRCKRPTTKCPKKSPRAWSRCNVKKRIRCYYGYITCCGRKIATTIASCDRGGWITAMRRVQCRQCRGKRKEGQTCGTVYGIGFVGKCVAGLVCKKRPPALHKKPSRNDPHICMKKAATKCPAKVPRISSRCNVKKGIFCPYKFIICCRRKIPRYKYYCHRGKWRTVMFMIHCRGCPKKLTTKCPAKAPRTARRCYVKKGIYCSYKFTICCGKKIPLTRYYCNGGTWGASIRLIRCRKCPKSGRKEGQTCGNVFGIGFVGKCVAGLVCMPHHVKGPHRCRKRTVKIPLHCIRWYDGCNFCVVHNGKILGCTRKHCSTKSASKCTKFKAGRRRGQTCGFVYGIGNVGNCLPGLKCHCCSRCKRDSHYPKTCIVKPAPKVFTKCDRKWRDKDGNGCQVYRTHGYCTASGGYGHNWNKFSFFANKGKTALTCPQCGCKSNCDAHWKDIHGLSCASYKEFSLCTRKGRRGPGWVNVTFDDFTNNWGRTALVCPQCGCKGSFRTDFASIFHLPGAWANYGWHVVADKRRGHANRFIAQTALTLGDNAVAHLNVTLSVKRVSCLKFSWKTHTEENYDYLRVYVNKVEKGLLAGFKKWQAYKVQLVKGKNLLSWVYKKDSGNSRGHDTVYLADLKLVNGPCPKVKSCFKSGWEYWPITWKKVSKVSSAKACQRLCQKLTKCQVFTYLTQKDSHGKQANNDCYIISVANGLYSKTLKGATSGPKFCA